jgi:hypothetical protein
MSLYHERLARINKKIAENDFVPPEEEAKPHERAITDPQDVQEWKDTFGDIPHPDFPAGIYQDNRSGQMIKLDPENDPATYMGALADHEGGSIDLLPVSSSDWTDLRSEDYRPRRK